MTVEIVVCIQSTVVHVQSTNGNHNVLELMVSHKVNKMVDNPLMDSTDIFQNE